MKTLNGNLITRSSKGSNMKTFYFLLVTLILINQKIWAADTWTVTAAGAASTIALTTTQTNLTVATVALGTSGTAGNNKAYSVEVTSLYGGLRNTNAVTKGASTANATLSYTVNFQKTGGSNPNTNNTLTINGTSAQVLFTRTDNGSGSSVSGNFRFTRTGTTAASMYSGTYTDTLTMVGKNTTDGTSITRTLVLTTTAVADTIALTITPTSDASNLVLTSTQTDLNIGTAYITANCQNGYTLSLTSTNAGLLKHSAVSGAPNTNEKIDYTLKFAGSSVTTSTTPVTIYTSNSATLLTTSTSIGNINMSYTGAPTSTKRAGTFTDNLTFTLQSQ